MEFDEAFVIAMAERGITVDPATLPVATLIEDSIGRIRFWLSELDYAISAGIEEASAEYAICYTLAEPDLNVAPDFMPLLQAFDQTSGQTLNSCLQLTEEAFQQALAGGGVG
jgi:hypothetical protein